MTAAKIRHIVLHAVAATAFVFGLNYFILNTGLQSAVLWGIVFGAMAATLAWQQTKR